MGWTPQLDAVLVETIRAGHRYADAARRIERETRGKFRPHRTTCLRRHRAIQEEASTRVDAIPARVRAPLSVRLAPPGVNVLALPLEAVERHPDGFEGVVAETLTAIPPGWTYSVDLDAGSDAIASARHQATLRGEDLLVIEQPGSFQAPVVAIGVAGRAKIVVLVVVRFSRGA